MFNLKQPISFSFLFKVFSVTYILTIAGKILFEWFFAKLNIGISHDLGLITAAIYFIISHVLIGPILTRLEFRKGARLISLNVLIPFSFMASCITAERYFKDVYYNLIVIDKPSDIFKTPNGRFFKINEFIVLPDYYFRYSHHKTDNKRGDEKYTNYYVAPVYDDISKSNELPLSQIALAISYSGVFVSNPDSSTLADFYTGNEKDYNLIDFNRIDYFEKIEPSHIDFENYLVAWDSNKYFDHNRKPTILLKQNGDLSSRIKQGRTELLWVMTVTYSICILVLWLFYRYKDSDWPNANSI